MTTEQQLQVLTRETKSIMAQLQVLQKTLEGKNKIKERIKDFVGHKVTIVEFVERSPVARVKVSCYGACCCTHPAGVVMEMTLNDFNAMKDWKSEGVCHE